MHYHKVGERGFYIEEQYRGKVCMFAEWPAPDSVAVVIATADSFSDIMKVNEIMTPYSHFHPVCKIL